MEGGNLSELLVSTKADDVLKEHKQLVTIDASATARQVLQTLSQNDIYSAPVFEGETCLGLVDFNDIVSYLVNIFVRKVNADPKSEEAVQAVASATFSRDDLRNMQNRFERQPAKELMNFSGQNPFKTLSIDSSLQDILNLFVKEGLSRVLLTNAEGKVVKLISQSTIANFIAKNIDGAEVASKTLEETNIGNKSVICATPQARTIDAFVKLSVSSISHLALTDDAGYLCGNISIKDIKGYQDDFVHLMTPVQDYINLIRRQNLKAVHPSIHANTTDTVGRTIVRLATIHIHRIYLTDIPASQLAKTSKYVPAGVVSLRDILSLFIS